MAEEKIVKEIGFTVDAGLIQRLGYELVGRAETAVSELIKNAYDADATVVDVEFIDANDDKGTLIISDNGIGMTEKQLVEGFMRISSTDKIHNPKSARYNRTKAGQKGIGRFATQRLGEKLTIITQTIEANYAIKIVIDWNLYNIDTELTSIKFPIEYIEKQKVEGTTLRIESLRDIWNVTAIKRVNSYVAELFQPDYLSEKSRSYNSAVQNDATFKVDFNQTIRGRRETVVNDKLAIFDKSLAVFEGYIDADHRGVLHIFSEPLGLNDDLYIECSDKEAKFTAVQDVYFRIHYFIYSRYQYYRGRITAKDLNVIQEMSKTAGGVRLYRNGFRVLPYGEPTDDWTNIDRRWSSESGITNVPLNNKNLFGFVEITAPDGKIFEETASREGLIENEAFRQLSTFVHKSLVAARQRVGEKIKVFKDEDHRASGRREETQQESTQEKIRKLRQILEESTDATEEGERTQESREEEKAKQEQKKAEGIKIVEEISKELEEASMLRVLAGMGLTIGEFTHEIKQFQPAVYGHISQLKNQNLSKEGESQLKGIEQNIDDLIAYTSYFSATVDQNICRETKPVDVLAVIDNFHQTINNDLKKNDIKFKVEEWDYRVVTVPMHRSEWSSILFNLYTNAKKAIKRAHSIGKILVEVGVERDSVFINFHDNGDGIPEENRYRIFNAFFTTSTPAGFDAPKNDQMVGTGLGLKIVKDIISSYKGQIFVTPPQEGYSTCFRIEIPRLKK